MRPTAVRLAELLGKKVAFCRGLHQACGEKALASWKPGEVLVLENTASTRARKTTADRTGAGETGGYLRKRRFGSRPRMHIHRRCARLLPAVGGS
jgi:hypothetical protein